MNCKACGSELPKNAKFCRLCGSPQKVLDYPKETRADIRIVCSRCGAALERDAIFCWKCGFALNETLPEVIKVENTAGSNQITQAAKAEVCDTLSVAPTGTTTIPEGLFSENQRLSDEQDIPRQRDLKGISSHAPTRFGQGNTDNISTAKKSYWLLLVKSIVMLGVIVCGYIYLTDSLRWEIKKKPVGIGNINTSEIKDTSVSTQQPVSGSNPQLSPNPNWNFLIGLCTTHKAEFIDVACDPVKARSGNFDAVPYQVFTEDHVISNLIFNKTLLHKKGIPEHQTPSDINYYAPASYDKTDDENVINVTSIGKNNCKIVDLYKLENGNLYNKSISMSGGCDEAQMATWKYFLKKSGGAYQLLYFRRLRSPDVPLSMTSSDKVFVTKPSEQPLNPDIRQDLVAKNEESALSFSADRCGDIRTCVRLMLEGIDSQQKDVVQIAEGKIREFVQPPIGDAKKSRESNKQGLDEYRSANYELGEMLFRQAVSQNPRDVEAQANLGLALVKQGKGNEAESVLMSAILLNTRRTSTWIPLALAYDLLGQERLAVSALLLGYEYSGNKEKTIKYFNDQSLEVNRESLSKVYKLALEKISASN